MIKLQTFDGVNFYAWDFYEILSPIEYALLLRAAVLPKTYERALKKLMHEPKDKQNKQKLVRMTHQKIEAGILQTCCKFLTIVILPGGALLQEGSELFRGLVGSG